MEAPWMLAASAALVLAAQNVRAGRRRSALNEALHELRRPLQALALATPGGIPAAAPAEWSLQMAAAALARLDREINGGPERSAVSPLAVETLVCAAAERWTAQASLAGCSLDLRWLAAGATVGGDRCALAQALDNLIDNAIEHGGPEIVLEASRLPGLVRLSVADSGREASRSSPRARAATFVTRLAGRNRHGHGLSVVRRTATAHGGRFELRRSASRTVATIELPLLGEDRRAA